MKAQFKQFINQISPLQEEVLDALLDCFHVEELKKNDHFVRDGAYATQIGFLKKGIVRAYFVDANGKEYNKQFFMPLSIIGAYTSLLTKRTNKIGQQALTDCEILVADYSKIESLYDKFHDFERFGRKVAEYYFLEKEEKEIQMALLDAAQRYELLREKYPKIELLVSQRHIASYLGISQTQLSRIRKKKASS